MLKKYIRLKVDSSSDSPTPGELLQLSRLSNKKEKHLVIVLISLAAIAFVAAVILISQSFLISVPASGGTLTEGVIGTPRFDNPLLATSNADRDLVSLVYSGLLRPSREENFINDLAESYEISSDNLVYTFHLRPNLKWHDGAPLTAADVVYTVHLAQDDRIKSPERANWDGVKVEAVDEETVRFTLGKPYAPFLENATLGILPEHMWKDVAAGEFALSVHNNEPVGSGPYKIEKIDADQSGVPKAITLTRNRNFSLGEPYLDKIILRFYPDEERLLDARHSGEIESASGLSSEAGKEEAGKGANIVSAPLYRFFAIFLNPNQSAALAELPVREALEYSAPRQEIVDFALGGFGTPISSLFNTDKTVLSHDLEARIATSSAMLEEAGWKLNTSTGIRERKGKPLQISLVTSDRPDLKLAVSLISDTWKKLGVDVGVKVYESSDLNTNLIRPRKFEALLFGGVTGHFPDPYAFWHTSQRLDPGLNIGSYTNPEADKALTTARESQDPEVRKEQYAIFDKLLSKDIPAIFLYEPHYIYEAPESVAGINLGTLNTPSDRFLNIYNWYKETDKIWTIFQKRQS